MTAVNDDFALTSKNNQGFAATFRLRNKAADGTYTPLDGDNYTFKATLKKSLSLTAPDLADFTITKVGLTGAGQAQAYEVTVSLTEAQMSLLTPTPDGKPLYYDFCGKHTAQEPETFWVSTFAVEAGLTSWP